MKVKYIKVGKGVGKRIRAEKVARSLVSKGFHHVLDSLDHFIVAKGDIAYKVCKNE